MSLHRALLVCLLSGVPAIAAGDQAGNEAPERRGESICESNKGIWNTSNNTCAVTREACEDLGVWEDGMGCVLPSINAAQCNSGGGMQAIGNACVIIYMTVDETTQ